MFSITRKLFQTSMNIRNFSIIPYVTQDNKSYDIYSRLLRDRIVMLFGPVDTLHANVVTSQLLLLESENPSKPIHLYICCDGGDETSAMSIFDTMQYISSPVHTLGLGNCNSVGALLLAGGEEGHRRALKNTNILLTQPKSGTKGTASDMIIAAKEVLKTREMINELFSKHSGQPIDVIEKVMDRDTYLNTEKAKDFGIIDTIIEKKPSNNTTEEVTSS